MERGFFGSLYGSYWGGGFWLALISADEVEGERLTGLLANVRQGGLPMAPLVP